MATIHIVGDVGKATALPVSHIHLIFPEGTAGIHDSESSLEVGVESTTFLVLTLSLGFLPEYRRH